ncbi:flagellar brake protein [Clostridium cochlearium]|uniref:flagellar brake protein n=1 Tax=Clostridium cochlearium TaxID=1494 RepID=UPI0022E4ED45|nr:flagellar brake domain-containing protein [Clostridium cochlearium]
MKSIKEFDINDFNVNGRIEILMDDGIYKSNIQDIDKDYIAISIPVKDGEYLPLRRGDRVEAVYYEKNKLYKFYTVVSGRKVDRVMMILLKHPDKIFKVQRRNFVRVPFVTEVLCAVLEKNQGIIDRLDNQFEFFHGHTLDISGGGIKLSTEKELERGELLMLTIPIKDENISVKGKIIRKEKLNEFVYGVSFHDVDNKTVEKIVSLLFQIMREQRKTGAKEE